ncbi:MAG: RidA family protein [Terriglobia bacterium]
MKRSIFTPQAPKPIGPYTQAMAVNGFLFLSGQVALDPVTNNLVADDIAAQTERVLKNLEAVLWEAGSSLRRVVKTSVFLADLNDFAPMNEVYARFFPEDPPARSTVECKRLPRGARVEIDAIALVG